MIRTSRLPPVAHLSTANDRLPRRGPLVPARSGPEWGMGDGGWGIGDGARRRGAVVLTRRRRCWSGRRLRLARWLATVVGRRPSGGGRRAGRRRRRSARDPGRGAPGEGRTVGF